MKMIVVQNLSAISTRFFVIFIKIPVLLIITVFKKTIFGISLERLVYN